MIRLRAHLFISGRVQGVLFRDTIKRRAKRVCGWVRNLPDKRVEAVLEGEKDDVEKLIKWARKGTFLSRVDKVEVEWENYLGEFDNFKINY